MVLAEIGAALWTAATFGLLPASTVYFVICFLRGDIKKIETEIPPAPFERGEADPTITEKNMKSLEGLPIPETPITPTEEDNMRKKKQPEKKEPEEDSYAKTIVQGFCLEKEKEQIPKDPEHPQQQEETKEEESNQGGRPKTIQIEGDDFFTLTTTTEDKQALKGTIQSDVVVKVHGIPVKLAKDQEVFLPIKKEIPKEKKTDPEMLKQ